MKNQQAHKERMNELFKQMNNSVRVVNENGKTGIQFSESMQKAIAKAFEDAAKPDYKPCPYSLFN